MDLKVDDVLICRVKNIVGVSVSLEIEGAPEVHATMALSEVAAGRIRNLREYVSVGRKVVCKILKISDNHVEFSLRRVTSREKEVAMDKLKKEKTLKSILKTVVENPGSVVEKIMQDHDIIDFFDEAYEDPRIFEKYIGKEESEKVAKIFSEKELRVKEVSREIVLKSDSDSGVKDIREILEVDSDIHYLGSSTFSVLACGEDFKEANGKMELIISEIEKRAKNKKAFLEIKKEK